MDVPGLLRTSLRRAQAQPCAEAPLGARHRERSRVWVETLADAFRQEYAADPTVRVFSKHHDGNRQDFGLNEFLYDVLVCRLAGVASAVHGKRLLYVRDVLWQVESEFARDSGQALMDFNKLVLGSAENKLFIGPRVHDEEAFPGVLKQAVCRCSGAVYAALVPHPDRWDAGERSVAVWCLNGNRWAPAP